VLRQIREWAEALEHRDAEFLATTMPQTEHWALFEELGDAVRYLDIETTGLSPGYHEVTVVGVYDGLRYQALVSGQNLTARTIAEALEGCRLLVTYYGRAFDVPFLCSSFPELRWPFPHFDLCFAGRRVGLTGGLKEVERMLGIERDELIAETDGFEAVRLWRAYQRGDTEAVNRLVEYNRADTENLARIAPVIYQRLCERG
jgi:uncharacterized protein YprB with RNaseH-like and TPR domain